MMQAAGWRLLVVLAAAVLCGGCSGGVKDRALPFAPDPVAEAKSLLSGYASGQPAGSESEMFEDLVARVSAVDQAKGAELRDFFAEIKAKRAPDRAKAKALVEAW
jgi:hypothetical protein